MGISVGGINLVNEIVRLRFDVMRLTKILNLILSKNAARLDLPTEREISEIEVKCAEDLKKLYPTAGISYNQK